MNQFLWIISVFFFVGELCGAQPTSQSQPVQTVLIAALAKVGTEILTTRDLQIHQFINENEPLFSVYVEKSEPAKLLVWETLIDLESKTTLNQTAAEDDIKRAMSGFRKKYEKDRLWLSLKVSEKELYHALDRHLSTKKLISLKMPKDMMSISQKEIENYYTQNKNQLGQRPLQEVQSKIEVGLRDIKLRERFQDWMKALGRTHTVEYFSGVQVQ